MLLVPAGFLIFRGISRHNNFSRGVLALNTNKSSYTPGEKIAIGMSSLDKTGHTICNSSLKLEITDPQKITANINVTHSPTCGDDNVTNDPDYLASFLLDKAGKYTLKLTNTDTGKVTKTDINVSENIPFDIQRSGATPINPFKADRYPMIITVTANRDYAGQIIEKIPADFKVIWQGPAKVEGINIIWGVNLKAGETKTLSYEYRTPQISPNLYKLGPARIIDSTRATFFRESRRWQIAVSKEITP